MSDYSGCHFYQKNQSDDDGNFDDWMYGFWLFGCSGGSDLE
jgi:hypothetical protein